MDTSEIHARRPNAKEILTPKSSEIFLHSRSQMEQSSCVEEIRYDLRGESDGSQLDTRTDSEVRNDFWSIEGNYRYRHHVEPGVKLHVPMEESFPIPLRCIDVTRRTHTTIEALQKSRTDDYWNIDDDRNLSEPWTGFTISNEKPPDGCMWSWEGLTKMQATTRPDPLWPEI